MSKDNQKEGSAQTALVLAPTSFQEAKEMANYYSQSSLLPPELRDKEADVFVTMMAGQELGLSPMASLRGIHVVKGRPTVGSHAMVAIVLASGKAEYFRKVESSPKQATYETKRKGAPAPQRQTFTMEQARRAQLADRDMWKKYPEEMLCARAKAMLARDVYPDLLMGVYEENEADELAASPSLNFIAPPPPTNDAGVQDAEVVEDANDAETVTEHTVDDEEALAIEVEKLRGAIEAAKDSAELELLLDRLHALPEADRESLRSPYLARRKELGQ